MAKTHDYTNQFWGHAVVLSIPKQDGTINMLGHGLGIEQGDTLTMKMESGRVGKMLVQSVSYLDNPRDMWDLVARFDGYADTQPTAGDRNAE